MFYCLTLLVIIGIVVAGMQYTTVDQVVVGRYAIAQAQARQAADAGLALCQRLATPGFDVAGELTIGSATVLIASSAGVASTSVLPDPGFLATTAPRIGTISISVDMVALDLTAAWASVTARVFADPGGAGGEQEIARRTVGNLLDVIDRRYVGSWVSPLPPLATGSVCRGGSLNEVLAFAGWLDPRRIFLVGTAGSSDGDVGGGYAGNDGWLAVTDAGGTLLSEQNFGGGGNDQITGGFRDRDGALLLFGKTDSGFLAPGTVHSGNHGGVSDGWVVKISSAGTVLWHRYVGTDNADVLAGGCQTSDGGYVVVGSVANEGGSVPTFPQLPWPFPWQPPPYSHPYRKDWPGQFDGFVGKLSADGSTWLWSACVGDQATDELVTAVQLADGRVLLFGNTTQFFGFPHADNHCPGNHGGVDGWRVTLAAAGSPPAVMSGLCYGGGNNDRIAGLRRTVDGGCFVFGYTDSATLAPGATRGSYHGGRDGWLMRFDNSGNLEWHRWVGGSGTDEVTEVRPTADGGCFVVGSTTSNDGDVSGNHGGSDMWLAKLSADGNTVEWQACLGGSGNDAGGGVVRTTDGGYQVIGTTQSIDGQVIGNHGGQDFWLVKTDARGQN